jgi:hypothetical protein
MQLQVPADILQCPTYSSESGEEEETAAILSGWIANMDEPFVKGSCSSQGRLRSFSSFRPLRALARVKPFFHILERLRVLLEQPAR